MIRLGKLESILLLSFLTLFSFPLLYVCRTFDNNTLTSWKWVFSNGGFERTLLFLCIAILLSLLISHLIPLEKYPVPVLVLVAGSSVLPLWSEPELLLDSGRYFLQAKNLSEYGLLYFFREWGHAITAWTDMPLAPFLYGIVLKYGNESRIVVQLFNTIIFILSVVLTYKLGSSLWNRETGFYGGLLLVGIPYLLTQVPLMLIDIHTMFFHLLAVYCFLDALRSGGNMKLFISSATLVLALFVKYSTWPMLALLPLSCFFVFPENHRQTIFKRAALILLPTAFAFIILISFKFDVLSEQMKILHNYQRPALKLWSENLASTFLFQCHPIITLLSLYALYRAWQQKDKRFLFVSLYCMLISVLHIYRIRYMIPLLPFVTLIAAYGITSIQQREVRQLTGCMIISSSIVILLTAYLPFFHTTSMMNIKVAGEYLNNLDEEIVEVFVKPQEKSEGSTFVAIPLLDLFTDKKIISRQKWPQEKPHQISPYSPLLFTWKQNKPSYYVQIEDRVPSPLSWVIISANISQNNGYKDLSGTTPSYTVTSFSRQSGVFRYRTIVSIYN